MSAAYKVGLLGLGTVGSQVAERLEQGSELVQRRTGVAIGLERILVRDVDKSRRYVPRAPLTRDPDEVLDDPAIDVIIEVIGGEEPPHQYLKRALKNRKHVITAGAYRAGPGDGRRRLLRGRRRRGHPTHLDLQDRSLGQ